MKKVIYYFTGTGNTLAVARKIAREMGDTELVPISSLTGQSEVFSESEMIGIAFPVYFLNLPEIVREFVPKLRYTGSPYIFGIATCGERPGGALFALKSLLEENGATLNSGFSFLMPENYIGPVDLMGDAPNRQDKFDAVNTRIPEVASLIHDRMEREPEGNNSFFLRSGGHFTKMLMTSVYNTPRRFSATDRCNQCRTCEKICPTWNITVENGKVLWGNRCIQCYACIHWCPKEAVEIGGRTAGKPRYHHPDITLADMLNKRSNQPGI